MLLSRGSCRHASLRGDRRCESWLTLSLLKGSQERVESAGKCLHESDRSALLVQQSRTCPNQFTVCLYVNETGMKDCHVFCDGTEILAQNPRFGFSASGRRHDILG